MKQPLEQFVPRVYRFALRLAGDPDTAEELTQETFLRAWRNRRQLRDREAARVWLFQIAANLFRDGVRRETRRGVHRDVANAELLSSDTTPERQLSDQEELRRALEAMNALPPRQRQVLYLHACEELSLAQIADILKITTDAAKASLSLARKRIREELTDVDPSRTTAKPS